MLIQTKHALIPIVLTVFDINTHASGIGPDAATTVYALRNTLAAAAHRHSFAGIPSFARGHADWPTWIELAATRA